MLYHTGLVIGCRVLFTNPLGGANVCCKCREQILIV